MPLLSRGLFQQVFAQPGENRGRGGNFAPVRVRRIGGGKGE